MARVTSKLQVTIPKAVADRYEIVPGADIAFEPAGEVIRVVPRRRPVRDPAERARLFGQLLDRQREREGAGPSRKPADRGWAREELYDRGRAR